VAFAALAFVACAAFADPGVQPTLTTDQIAAQMIKIHPKTVVFVFDVTGSTNANGVFSNERAATSELLRQGCVPGDRVVLLSFGTAYTKLFDEVLGTPPDFDTLIGDIPGATQPGHGTNIRLPHHAALRMIDQSLPEQGVIVLLTDSFNDQPLPADSSYPQYLQYYAPDSLTHYPHTPQNADYERLLKKLMPSGKLHEYGVGVEIADSGRPVERQPLTTAETDAGWQPPSAASQPHEKPTSNLPEIIGAVLVAGVVLIVFIVTRATAPLPVRLGLGDKSLPTDFRLRRGARIGLGGSLGAAGGADEVFPIRGLAEPAAFIRSASGSLEVVLGKPAEGVRVFHNGSPLEKAEPVRSGDEIRVSLPATETAAARDIRVAVRDPHEPLFT
jgi:hypothetical protein